MEGSADGGSFKCRFCGGSTCKRCSERSWRRQGNAAFRGLNSDWIVAPILAMQRPSSRLLRKYGLLTRLPAAGVRAIFNLQLRGEHPHCGDGILDSGFSYWPQEVMDAGMSYFNFGWVDFGTPRLSFTLNVVQVMASFISCGHAVAVHCHAGYGRTGLAIACFFVYYNGLPPAEAAALTRAARPGCIQKDSQLRFVTDFHDQLVPLRQALPWGDAAPAVDLPTLLKRQAVLMHGPLRKFAASVPQLFRRMAAPLTRLALAQPAQLPDAMLAPPPLRPKKLARMAQRVNSGKWWKLPEAAAADLRSLRIASQLLLEAVRTLAVPLLTEDCRLTVPEAEDETMQTLAVVLRPLALIRTVLDDDSDRWRQLCRAFASALSAGAAVKGDGDDLCERMVRLMERSQAEERLDATAAALADAVRWTVAATAGGSDDHRVAAVVDGYRALPAALRARVRAELSLVEGDGRQEKAEGKEEVVVEEEGKEEGKEEAVPVREGDGGKEDDEHSGKTKEDEDDAEGDSEGKEEGKEVAREEKEEEEEEEDDDEYDDDDDDYEESDDEEYDDEDDEEEEGGDDTRYQPPPRKVTPLPVAFDELSLVEKADLLDACRAELRRVKEAVDDGEAAAAATPPATPLQQRLFALPPRRLRLALAGLVDILAAQYAGSQLGAHPVSSWPEPPPAEGK
eukprot:PLAT4156.1.p1 GENE.PLAT4156.1~~PLAT4156.1.p1  ORF type:complete len:679 (-),score=322.66 PLAT4156.1:30-2066(-)